MLNVPVNIYKGHTCIPRGDFVVSEGKGVATNSIRFTLYIYMCVYRESSLAWYRVLSHNAEQQLHSADLHDYVTRTLRAHPFSRRRDSLYRFTPSAKVLECFLLHNSSGARPRRDAAAVYLPAVIVRVWSTALYGVRIPPALSSTPVSLVRFTLIFPGPFSSVTGPRKLFIHVTRNVHVIS
jgi:hypothetical protein